MSISIQANIRQEQGRKTDALRVQGVVPAVMYGFDTDPIVLSVDRNESERAYAQAGMSMVISLEVEGAVHNVLLQEIQRDALTDEITHVDFRRIDMDKKVETSVAIVLTGVSPAVKDLGGTLLQSVKSVHVSSLPSALVRSFELDAATLETFENTITVGDIVAPEGMEVLDDVETVIATVAPPRKVEAIEALDDEVVEDVDSVEVTKEKSDGDAAPSGESAS